MAISLEGRVHWRMKAPYHVQFQLEPEEESPEIPCHIFLGGCVVRVFRSDGRLRLGDRVRFKIWLCQPGDEQTGQAFIHYDAFTRANYIEAYLLGQPPDYMLAAYEFEALGAPTDEPTLTVAQLQRMNPPRRKSWWRRLLSR